MSTPWGYFFAGFGLAMLCNWLDSKYGYAIGLALGNYVRIFIHGK